MPVREFNIPFGPDKTGGLGFAAPNDSANDEGVKDPFAEPPVDAFARDTSHVKEGLPDEPELDDIDEFNDIVESPSPSDQPNEAVVSEKASVPAAVPATAAKQGGSERSSARKLPERDEKPETASNGEDVQKSFAALKDSFSQSRELKAREREIDELQDQMRLDREELVDREDILAHYDALVAKQDALIEQATRVREEDKAELSRLAYDIEDTAAKLAQMREHHDQQMQPLETDLGRARASAEQAKNDERSRKSELNAAESELRRAGASGDATMLQAKVEQIQLAYDRARNASEEAQAALGEVKRIYDDALNQIEQREGPLARAIKDMEQQEDDLKERIEVLGDDISAARKRRQYCDAVYQYPEETEKLRRTLASDEAVLQEMQQDYDDLLGLLAQTKARARKAKLALVLIALVVVLFIAALLFIFLRG